VAAPSNYILYL